jgi:hypothetical protein
MTEIEDSRSILVSAFHCPAFLAEAFILLFCEAESLVLNNMTVFLELFKLSRLGTLQEGFCRQKVFHVLDRFYAPSSVIM